MLRLKEQHLDAVTATSGSGPAYFFLLAEAMIEACILLGLSRDVATELIIQTMLGSAKMLRDTGKHPVELREMVTSPGGTTIAAIRHLEEAGVRAAFLNAIDAACQRSLELAQGGDDDDELAGPTGRKEGHHGQGILAKVRSAKDRQRKKKAREVRQAADAGRRPQGREEEAVVRTSGSRRGHRVRSSSSILRSTRSRSILLASLACSVSSHDDRAEGTSRLRARRAPLLRPG